MHYTTNMQILNIKNKDIIYIINILYVEYY